MYNYFQQQPQYQSSMAPNRITLKGRPVSSIEEARATAIDFDGSIFYFPDLANNRIYTKQINLDGTASLSMYELKPIQIQQQNTENFVTREEFSQAMQKLQEMLITQQEESAPQETTAQVQVQTQPKLNF